MDRYLKRNCKPGAVLFFMIFLVINHPVSGFSSNADAVHWKTLRTGKSFALLRHAIAPGVGDPEYFTLGDCSTQRNLPDEGRDQALAIGDKFRAKGISKAKVLSSQWCRCQETAELLKLGAVETLPELNSFFRQFERRAQQTQDLQDWLGTRSFDLPLVLVTHQVNITALTGFFPVSGELVVAQRTAKGEIVVLGSIKTQ